MLGMRQPLHRAIAIVYFILLSKSVLSDEVMETTVLISNSKPNEIPQNPTPLPTVNVSDAFYYRENVSGYPDLSKLEHLLKNSEHLFEENILDTKSLRIPDEENYVGLCGSEKLNIHLAQEVKNKDDKEVFLVNAGKYAQTIVAEVCGKLEDTPCGNYVKSIHEGYEPLCKQNYIYRKMVVMKPNPNNPDGYDVVEDEIPIPASCQCVLKHKSNV